jgi:hypothetical protein
MAGRLRSLPSRNSAGIKVTTEKKMSPVEVIQFEESQQVALSTALQRSNERIGRAIKKQEEDAEVERNKYLKLLATIRIGQKEEGHWKDGQVSAHEVSRKTGHNRATLSRDVLRLHLGQEIFPQFGRKESKPQSFLDNCIALAEERDMNQNSLRHVARGTGNDGALPGANPRDVSGSTAKFFNDEHKKWVLQNIPNPTAAQLMPLTDYHIRQYEIACVPEKTLALKEDRQNMARFKANGCLYNFVSFAALIDLMWGCTDNIDTFTNEQLLELAKELGIHPRLFFVLDKSSTYAGTTNRKDQLRSAEGSKKKLKSVSKQPCAVATGDEDKNRAIGYSLMSNTKKIVMWLTHLKDKCWNGKEPRIVCLTHPFYVLVRGNDIDKETGFTDKQESDMIINELVLPLMQKCRNDFEDDQEAIRQNDKRVDMEIDPGAFEIKNTYSSNSETTSRPSSSDQSLTETDDSRPTSADEDSAAFASASSYAASSSSSDRTSRPSSSDQSQPETDDDSRPSSADQDSAAGVSASSLSSSSSSSRGSTSDPKIGFRTGVPKLLDNHNQVRKLNLLILDGEYNNLESLMAQAANFCDEELIEILKTAAACSKTQSPPDVMKTFMVLHQFYYGHAFENVNITDRDFQLPDWMETANDLTKDCDPADRVTFRKYLATLEYALDLVNKQSTTEKGFRNGIWPPSPRRIMEMCPGPWGKLTVAEQNTVLSAIRLVAHQILDFELVTNLKEDDNTPYVTGVADDHFMESLLSHILGPIKYGTTDEEQGEKRKKTDKPINQWRSTRLYAPAVRNLHLRRQQEKLEKVVEAKRVSDIKAAQDAAAAAHRDSPEGIAEAKFLQDKKDLVAHRKQIKNDWEALQENAGKKYVPPKAPPKPRAPKANVVISCSYCGIEWTAANASSSTWIRCNAWSHSTCNFRCCGVEVCMVQHNRHVAA